VKFKVGDKVKVISNKGRIWISPASVGLSFVIRDVEDDDDTYMVTYLGDDYWITEEDLELDEDQEMKSSVPEMKFKVGDIVEFAPTQGLYDIYTRGHIAAVYPLSSYPYFVRNVNNLNDHSVWKEEFLSLVTNSAEKVPDVKPTPYNSKWTYRSVNNGFEINYIVNNKTLPLIEGISEIEFTADEELVKHIVNLHNQKLENSAKVL
jgi:hypothetical protein